MSPASSAAVMGSPPVVIALCWPTRHTDKSALCRVFNARATESSMTHVLVSLSLHEQCRKNILTAMRIAETAHRHGVDPDDMRHAVTMAIGSVMQDEDVTVYVGPARSGRPLLEVGVLDAFTDPVVIHAMPARQKFIDRI